MLKDGIIAPVDNKPITGDYISNIFIRQKNMAVFGWFWS